jgi:hypothetical protein
LRLTWRPSYEGFGRRPMRERGCRQGGRRTKASQGGNRGEEGRCTTGRDLWGFEDCERIADVRAEPSGAQSCRREHGRRARSVVSRRRFGVGAAPGADLRTRRGQRKVLVSVNSDYQNSDYQTGCAPCQPRIRRDPAIPNHDPSIREKEFLAAGPIFTSAP